MIMEGELVLHDVDVPAVEAAAPTLLGAGDGELYCCYRKEVLK